MSQIVVPTDTPGFSVSRKLDKLGNRSSDTAELVFDDVRVPVANTIGEIGRGFQQQMAQFQDERMIGRLHARSARCRARRSSAPATTCRERKAFGKPLLANQYAVSTALAELAAEVDVLPALQLRRGRGAASRGEDITRFATIAKLKAGRLAREVADICLQFHGGIGYMEETWPARFFRDTRLLVDRRRRRRGHAADPHAARGDGEAMTSETDDAAAGTAVPARAPVTWHLTNRGVLTITLDDPDSRNVLNNRSVPMLIEAFELAASDAGPRVWCSPAAATRSAPGPTCGARSRPGTSTTGRRPPWPGC